MDISQFNADWLKAWSAKDTAGVLRHYHPDCIYKDAQVPAGLKGHDQLRGYLDGLFAATGAMRFDPDEVWRRPTATAVAGFARLMARTARHSTCADSTSSC